MSGEEHGCLFMQVNPCMDNAIDDENNCMCELLVQYPFRPLSDVWGQTQIIACPQLLKWMEIFTY